MPHHHIQKLYPIKSPIFFTPPTFVHFFFCTPSVQITLFPLNCNSNLLIFLALDSVIKCICHLSWKLVILELDKHFICAIIQVIDKKISCNVQDSARAWWPSTRDLPWGIH